MSSITGFSGYVGSLTFIGTCFAFVLILHWPMSSGKPRLNEVMLGKKRLGEKVSLGLDEIQQGVLVAGSPGAGKTTLLVAMIRRLPPEIGCIVIDLKGDVMLGKKLGIPPERTFRLDTPSAAWNPLAHGNPASWRDVLMSTQEWTEPHYRQAAARFIGVALDSLNKVHKEVELDAIIELLEQPTKAKGLVRELPDEDGHLLERTVEVITGEASLKSGVLGLGNRLALLRDSPATRGKFGVNGGIDLDRVFLQGDRVLFSMPAATFPDEAPAIAAAVIQTIGAAGQRLARGDEFLRTVLVVDESPQLTGRQIRQAMAIGRGAGIGTTIAVQDHADLENIDPGTREAVETGANTWITMRQVSAAESVAMALGSKTVTRQTKQHDAYSLWTDTGMRSEREVEEFRVSPNVIRSLPRGEAIVWRRLRGGTIDRIRVLEAPPIEEGEGDRR